MQGTPVSAYAEAHGLGLRERLTLLEKVCAGVQHAHQKGVIHCDLKPGNILVDGSGQPKIVDFGIGDEDLRDWRKGDGPPRTLETSQICVSAR